MVDNRPNMLHRFRAMKFKMNIEKHEKGIFGKERRNLLLYQVNN